MEIAETRLSHLLPKTDQLGIAGKGICFRIFDDR